MQLRGPEVLLLAQAHCLDPSMSNALFTEQSSIPVYEQQLEHHITCHLRLHFQRQIFSLGALFLTLLRQGCPRATIDGATYRLE